MKIQCPTNELLRYFEAMKKDPTIVLPEVIKEHAQKCVHCTKLLNSPHMWNLFILANKRSCERQTAINEKEAIHQKQIRLIKYDKKSDGIMALVTDTSQLTLNKVVRITPLAINPFKEEIDETDVVLSAKNTPMGLSALFEWWNDRPVLSNIIGKNFGCIDEVTFKKIENLIKYPATPKNLTEDIYVFREVEKAKGDLLSASFYEMFIGNEEPSLAADSNDFSIAYIDFKKFSSANEELALAADFNDTYKRLKEYLKSQNSNYYVTGTNVENTSYSIFSKNHKPFVLQITLDDNSVIEHKSNQVGKLYLKNGIPDKFAKLYFFEQN